jgi:hypothetical protein
MDGVAGPRLPPAALLLEWKVGARFLSQKHRRGVRRTGQTETVKVPDTQALNPPEIIAAGELRALLQKRAHVQAAVEAVPAVLEKHVAAYFARQRRWQVDTAPRGATIKPGAGGRAFFQSSLNQPANARLRPVQRRAPP